MHVDESMTVAQGFAAIAHACLRHFRLNEMVLFDTPDAAALHQARVAMRRLRGALSLFRPVVADDHVNRLREDLRWFTGHLGHARNIDVLSKRLSEHDKAAETGIFDQLSKERESAYSGVLDALKSKRFRRLMLGMVRSVEIGAWRSRPKANAPLRTFASRRLSKRWLKVKVAGARLRELDGEARHRLRIDIKKLRYSAEFFAGLYPSKAAARKRGQFLKSLETLQEELGALNDDATARALLSALAFDAEMARALENLLVVPAHHERRLEKSEQAYRLLLASADYW